MKTSIVSGQAPCLLSINALRSLGAKLDLSAETPTICFSKIAQEAIPLSYAPNGHLLMPLFNFFKNAKDSLPNSAKDSLPQGPRRARSLTKTALEAETVTSDKEGSAKKTLVTSDKEGVLTNKVTKTLRSLARDTKGPWVSEGHHDKVVAVVRTIDPNTDFELLAVSCAYKARVLRRPPHELDDLCTHRMRIAVRDDGTCLCFPWSLYSRKVVTCQHVYPLTFTCFAVIRPTTDRLTHTHFQWKPRNQSQQSLIATVLPSTHFSSNSSTLSPPPGLTLSQPSRLQEQHLKEKGQDELQLQRSESEVPTVRCHTTVGGALCERRAPTRWKRTHDLVGLQQVLQPSHGHLTAEARRDEVLRSTPLSTVSKLQPEHSSSSHQGETRGSSIDTSTEHGTSENASQSKGCSAAAVRLPNVELLVIGIDGRRRDNPSGSTENPVGSRSGHQCA